ncbi:DNA repair protein RecO [Weissella ceti]|uniref:DNA repair protein RecO n=1 Tax=Weissella ceti TaxID=759620 RepID=A0ABT3E2U5_9LACO|nr:DNA repair protein RecO [Weissella ceti]MCW0952745.1 DNA repair protein RecO [Weissella ceti]QVK12445.1 DNA repair protein RecO [Weissella ceti]
MTEVFDAIVMYQRPHKEHDLMVKMLTREHGKRMFYIRHGKSKRYAYAADVLPFTIGQYEGTINATGLSFMNDVKQSHVARVFLEDVNKSAYMTYIMGLVDAAFVDNQPLTNWYDEVALAIEKMETGLSPMALANYFELKLLPAFGVHVDWERCVICEGTTPQMDFSMTLGGLLCAKHFGQDEHRMHIAPKALYILKQFSQVHLKQMHSLSVKTMTLQEMSRVLDAIYDDQVGVQLKAKSFIKQLQSWDQRLQSRTPTSETTDKDDSSGHA